MQNARKRMPMASAYKARKETEELSESARTALIARMKTKEITRVKISMTRAGNGNGGQLPSMAPNGD
jgi:hypothetical protein